MALGLSNCSSVVLWSGLSIKTGPDIRHLSLSDRPIVHKYYTYLWVPPGIAPVRSDCTAVSWCNNNNNHLQ
jgi:hypothetical protein